MGNRARVALTGLFCLLFMAGCGGDNIFPTYPLSGTEGVVRPGTIEGVVTAGSPLGGVSIILVNRDSTVTDGAGRYRFANLPASTYSVSIRVPLNHALAPGDSATRTVGVGAGGVETVNWSLIRQGALP
jgi:hypothetical protein